MFTPFPEKMRINRAFSQQMYQRFNTEGYTHFLDIGAGPMPRGHEWVPEGQFLYVDHNPDIVQHARSKLRSRDRVTYEVSSVGDLPRILGNGLGERALGGERRIAIASNAVLMFVDDDDIRNTFAFLYDWAAPGSAVEITMTGVTSSEQHLRAKMIGRFFRWIDAPMYIRSVDRFADLLAPWKILRGPVPTWEWLNWPPSKNTAGVGFDIYALRLVKE
jgi:hypothetical protein